MRSRILLALPVSLAPLMAMAIMLPSGGQTGQSKTAPTFAQTTGTFFTQNCTSCHNPKTKAGSLDLVALQSPDSVAKNRETWESVLRKIRTGEMPPPGSPKPTQAAIKATMSGIEAEFERADKRDASNPGRVTARRLNRAEYNNTIRDLLGVNTHPADDFPQDDSGYGFDNIGDVLSLSSSQMERYVSAAEKVARTAVFGAEPMQPTLAILEAHGRRIVQTMTVPARYDASGFTLPNSLHTMHRFPVDAEYLFRLKLEGLRPLGSDALHLALWIDGK
ncbi:MAG: Gluconolactonase, partial [Chthonomonadales bacterium]|nr:Gluconolactonase [Chthonomonadales bacterium]